MKARKLNARQEAFALEYCRDHNASQAAIRAGYSKKGAGQTGYNLLKHPEIKALIKARTAEHIMSVEEALRLVAVEATTNRDPAIRLRAIDMILKAGGAYTEERKITGSITLVDETPGPKKRSIK